MIGCSAAIAAMAGGRLSALTLASPGAPKDFPIFVVVFLRGGMDGLNFVAPIDDKDYLDARPPDVRIVDNGDRKGLQISGGPTNGDWRMHYLAGGLKELYDSKHLAIVHACGLTNSTRSHFEAMDLMERGVTASDMQNLSTGWMSRWVSAQNQGGQIPAISIGGSLANLLLGFPGAGAINDLGGFNFWGGDDHKKGLGYLLQGESWLHENARQAYEIAKLVQSKVPRNANGEVTQYAASGSKQYPQNDIGNAMKTLAQMVRMEVGVQAATVDYGGWDTHQDQFWPYQARMKELSDSIAAFYDDLSAFRSRLHIVVVSEFGRRVKANASQGTDHGHGNAMMVLGPNVNGGKIHGRWPGLAVDQLDERNDLAITTDYRHVLCEMLQKSFGYADPMPLFPGLKDIKPVGVVRA